MSSPHRAAGTRANWRFLAASHTHDQDHGLRRKAIAETQAVLNFCAAHNIGPDIEVIDIKDINDAYSKVEDGEVRFRYVIDMATLKQAAA